MLLKEIGVVTSAPTLADFTRLPLIVPRLREQDTAGVVKELSQVLHEHGAVPDLLSFYHAAMNHEFLVNSATDCGMALPHARLHGVGQSGFAFGRSEQPLLWGTGPAAPVSLVFLLAVPATDAAGHLRLLSALAQLGREPDLLDALRSHDTAEGILDLFRQIRVRGG